ncbi:integrating conjugative element protein [Salinisphaera japonica YTM-1]|uniref:Integrating conjugative element protein n=2 Tax=Salinisphaera TaxID=180541 RepID=A0A423PEQ2_9GAMM|nr:integrating conjugative element protein [Salinisphaera japonica YTM-1]
MMTRVVYAITGIALLAAASAALAGTEVFTVAGVPVTHVPDNATVVELDKPSRLDKQLSQGLPDKKDTAARAVQKRLAGFKEAYGEAYSGLMRAWRLGVTKVPAVVVDGTYVVYGQPNVTAAVAEIRRAETREK